MRAAPSFTQLFDLRRLSGYSQEREHINEAVVAFVSLDGKVLHNVHCGVKRVVFTRTGADSMRLESRQRIP